MFVPPISVFDPLVGRKEMFQVLQAVIDGNFERSVILFGRHGEIDEVIKKRIAHSSQAPRAFPDHPYWIYVSYEFTARGEIKIWHIELKFKENARKLTTFYRRNELWGEVEISGKGGLKHFYLSSNGTTIQDLREFLIGVEDRHSLRELMKFGPDAIPVDAKESDDIGLFGDFEEDDLLAENIANQAND